MDFSEEALSLKENPLPEEFSDDEILPTSIVILDNGIENLEKEISKLNMRLQDLYNNRTRLVDHAVKLGIMEDSKYKIIEVISYGNRLCDPKKLKESNPETWKVYESAYYEKSRKDSEDLIRKSKENIEEKVLLGLADKIFGKKNVDLCSQIPATIKYEVRRK